MKNAIPTPLPSSTQALITWTNLSATAELIIALAAVRQTCVRSERNFVVHVLARFGARTRHGGLARRGTTATERSEIGAAVVGADITAATTTHAVQHGELRIEALQHHLGGIAVLALLVLPFARLQLALDIDLRAFL